MTGKKVNRLPQTLLELVLEIVVLLFTIGVGLGTSRNNTTAFYVATFVQAVNNLYMERIYFCSKFDSWIVCQAIVVMLSSAIVILLSFLYLADAGFGFQESNVTLVIIAVVLAIPICINAYEIRQQLKAE